MDYSKLEKLNYSELKSIAEQMELPQSRSRGALLKSIIEGLKEYEEYKKKKLDKYKKGVQLGSSGKEGTTYLVTTRKKQEYAMKTFRKTKSSATLIKEAELQKLAADVGISPNVIDIDTVSKYIVMEKMDEHLLNVMEKQGGDLTKSQQKQIISIYKKLDKVGVFHGDANLMNYMCKNSKIYIIDFGMAKEITIGLSRRLGTSTPNLNIMTLGMALKLRDSKCPPSSYEVFVKYLTDEQKEQFGFNLKKDKR